MKFADTIAPGTYSFFCTLHRAAMTGKVTVVAADAKADPPTRSPLAGQADDLPSSVMNRSMMAGTEIHQIFEVGDALVSVPVLHVMKVQSLPGVASGEPAAPVAGGYGSTLRRGRGPAGTSEVEWVPVQIVIERDDAGVAGEAVGGGDW